MAAPKKSASKDALSAGHILYRAKVPCRIGHYRDAGEVFSWPRFEECPAHLEEVGAQGAPAAEAPPAPPAQAAPAAGVTPPADSAPGVTPSELPPAETV